MFYIKHYIAPVLLLAFGAMFGVSCNEEYQFTHGNVYGTITDATTGLPIENCNVSIVNADESISDRQVSGADGAYKTKDLSEGVYMVSVEKDDYYTGSSKKVEVIAGETTQCDIILGRIPARITSDTDNLDFGSKASLSTLSFKIVNKYLDELEWAVEYDCEWILSISPADGTLPHGRTETIVVKIDRAKLSEGENKTNIVVKSTNGQGGVNISINAIGERKESPVLNVTRVSDVDMTSAVLSGEVISSGVPAYTQRGFTCSLISKDDEAEELYAELNDNASFTYLVSNLLPGKQYYVRAFAINEAGKVWSSNEVSFTTISSVTSVQTLQVTDIDVVNGKATFNGVISDAGVPSYSEKGFCYGTSVDPTVSNTKVIVSGTDAGEYLYICSGLSANSTYYVRAYAVQYDKIIYGTTVPFSTNTSATVVTTSEATNITTTTATLNGSISKVGSPVYSVKGFCYSDSPNPTINNTKIDVEGNGIGSFTANIYGLSYNQTYYYKAYAIQDEAVVYGEEVRFKTDFTETKVTTSDATNVTSSSATLNGTIIDVGDPVYSEKGFCYSVYPNPTISNVKVVVEGNDAGNYSEDIYNLTFNTIYYYRAYVIQNGEVIYGSEAQFTSGYTVSVVETYSNVDDITYDTAELSYIIKNLGDPQCTESGMCYSTSSNPTISSNVVTGSLSTFKQTLAISGLTENTTYYFRAFVKQDGKVVNGSVYSFKTATRPSVSTLNATNLQNPYGLMNMWQVQLNGKVNSVGNPNITKRGFKYSTNGDPEGSGTTESVSGSSVGNYSVTLTGLRSNTTYYVRAYVKNSIGYEYGELITFTTGD